ncbi:unnamed protein product [Pseudo-nitzschia multistriata]|uniref:EF-hand domain-containing protein n=1 Tax=Pseudo-nitzschia multistriata TaxID=183589 RepID=A0A448ZAQ9_9STRA|nr:unnamed protein product [Pseudo-nitzschia multistriata]
MKGTLTCLLGMLVSAATAESSIFNTTSLSIGDFVDTEECFSAIKASASEKDGNQKMDPEEYVDFVKAYGPDGFLKNTTEFEELPLILTTNFYVLACLCDPDLTYDCVESCVGPNTGIETYGMQSADNLSDDEKSFLFLVCSQTSMSIDRVMQSISPSAAPVISPNPSSVSPAPTGIASSPPSKAPVDDGPVVEEEVIVSYSIGIKGVDTTFEDYSEELVNAMDSLAPTVLQEMSRRQLRVGRSLQTDPTVFLPTSIVDKTLIGCPENLVTPVDRCESVTASVLVFFQPNVSNPGQIAETFQDNLSKAIFDGGLQEFLESTVVYIVDKNALKSVVEGGGNSTAGIAVGVVVGLALVVAIAYFVTGRQGKNDREAEELLPAQADHLTLDKNGKNEPSQAKLTLNTKDANIVDSSAVDPAKPKGLKTSDNKSGGDDMSNVDSGDASSSNAGDSGWSSSAGIDSMNTGSADGLDFEKSPIPAIATTLPLISQESSSARRTEHIDTSDALNLPPVTRDDLDSAIEAGDWAAVGATAALLAAASDSQSYSSKSEQYTGTRSRSGSSVSSLDVARAAELDHLVDAGDWEGVVLAAAKYEGDESKDSLPSESVSGSDTRSNADTAGQTADSSVGSSKGLKRQEYKAIVEDLVQRVVPEEIQNVDEMMLQFRGREDELVETLRTMQERAVAQKARSSSQRAAKQQAKLTSAAAKIEAESSIPARSSKSIGKGQVSAAKATAKSLGTGEIESPLKKSNVKETLSGTGDQKERSKDTQSALEAAIEAGDWDAVGEAAAILTDTNSLTSADTDEINKYADGVSTDGSSAAGSKNLADVADELEELIEAGDWKGVVQAASNKKGTSNDNKVESNETRRMRRLKHLQEEQEALAQAEIWTAIAEQSRQESDTRDQGAADAADWAISRSLNALVEAEISGINDQSTVGTDGDSLQQATTKDEDGTESGNEV